MTNPIDSSFGALDQLRRRSEVNRLRGYEPYPFQRAYHRCESGHWETGAFKQRSDVDVTAKQVLLSASNQIGKSQGGYADDAFHATGDYPDWWDGPDLTEHLRRFPEMWIGGPNNDKVRDIGQKYLCGDPRSPEKWGTGWVPKDALVGKTPKRGVSNAHDSVQVRHKAGFIVHIVFKSYDAALLDWTGETVGFIHLDEEPPDVIYNQCLARMIASGGYVKMTFTPEAGQKQVLSQFITDLQEGQLLIFAGLNEARHEDGRTHLDERSLKQLLGAIPAHEYELRTTGKPILGAGAVFPVVESLIRMDEPILLSPTYPRICGMDFGSGGVNHPTAAVWLAVDRDSKMTYVYDGYRSSAVEMAVHAAAVRRQGPWIPVAWPHDGNRATSYGGPTLRNEYAKLGVNMLSNNFTNPDEKGFAVEPGITAMLVAMQEGRFKVFPHMSEWFEEYRLYHRSEKDNSIVPKRDDLMSATRVAFQSTRYAQVEEMRHQLHARPQVAQGARTWNPTLPPQQIADMADAVRRNLKWEVN